MERAKRVLREQASLATLRAVVAALGLVGVDRRSRRRMAAALEPVAPEELLDSLGTPALREVAALLGLPQDGRRETLLERLGAGRAAPRPADGEAFVALDFETADAGRDSACAIGLVRVEGQRIVRREAHLIRPPRRHFQFTWLHGIDWPMVAHAPSFGELWPALLPLLHGADLLVAHNAAFDRSVLRACCTGAGLTPPAIPFACTVKLAREQWNLYPTKLPDVCRHLGLSLRHHDAASDAEACARILMAIRAERAEGHA